MLRVKRKFSFQWEWCDMCKAWFIRCPKCGNNCCNAGWGEVDGEECDVCPLCYSYQSLADETGKAPSYEPYDEKQKRRIFIVE